MATGAQNIVSSMLPKSLLASVLAILLAVSLAVLMEPLLFVKNAPAPVERPGEDVPVVVLTADQLDRKHFLANGWRFYPAGGDGFEPVTPPGKLPVTFDPDEQGLSRAGHLRLRVEVPATSEQLAVMAGSFRRAGRMKVCILPDLAQCIRSVRTRPDDRFDKPRSVIHIPPGTGSFEIEVEVLAWADDTPAFTVPPAIGTRFAMLNVQIQWAAVGYGVVGLFLVVALYNFLRGLVGVWRRESLLFCIFCVATGTRVLTNSALIWPVFPDLSLEDKLLVEYITYALISGILPLIINIFLGDPLVRRLANTVFAISVFLSIYLCFLPPDLMLASLPLLHLAAFGAALLEAWMLVSGLRAGRRAAKALTLPMILIWLANGNDIMFFQGMPSLGVELIHYCLIIFIFQHGLLIASREQRSRAAIEEHSLALARVNEQLQDQAEELVEARRAAEQANEEKSRFLANTSHELRTPLNAIIGFSQLLQTPGISHQKKDEYVRDIELSGQHLLSLINDVLDMSRLEAGKLELERVWTRLADVGEFCIDVMGAQAQQKNISLTLASDQSPDVQVMADRKILRQILFNLLSNAVKYTQEGGSVRVSWAIGDDGALRLEVQDNGTGMTRREIDIALTPFGRAGDPYQENKVGTGLGLPIAISLLELHGATLDIDSGKGRGTSVFLRFGPEDVRRVG